MKHAPNLIHLCLNYWYLAGDLAMPNFYKTSQAILDFGFWILD
jgi:hypothetical protein